MGLMLLTEPKQPIKMPFSFVKNPKQFKFLPNFLWQVPNIVMYLFGQVPHFSELLLAAQILQRKEQNKGKKEKAEGRESPCPTWASAHPS